MSSSFLHLPNEMYFNQQKCLGIDIFPAMLGVLKKESLNIKLIYCLFKRKVNLTPTYLIV